MSIISFSAGTSSMVAWSAPRAVWTRRPTFVQISRCSASPSRVWHVVSASSEPPDRRSLAGRHSVRNSSRTPDWHRPAADRRADRPCRWHWPPRRSTGGGLEARSRAGECKAISRPSKPKTAASAAPPSVAAASGSRREPGDADAPADHGEQQHAGKQAGDRQRHDHFERHSASPRRPRAYGLTVTAAVN